MRSHAKAPSAGSTLGSAERRPATLGAIFATALIACLGIGAPAASAAAPTFTGLSLSRTQQSAGQATALLNARINPNGAAITSCQFEYGTTDAYGQSAPCLASTITDAPFVGKTGTTILPAAAELTSLAKETTYHFRLTVTNADGTATSDDEAFTTPGTPDQCPTCIGVDGKRRVELVSVGEKNQNSPTSAFLAADGERILYSVGGGTPDATFGFVNYRFADRTASGWTNRNALPPNDDSFSNGTNHMLHLMTDDLSIRVGGVLASFLGNSPSPFTLLRMHDDVTQEAIRTFPSVKDTETSTSPAVAASDDLEHVFYATRQLIDSAQVPGTNGIYDLGAGGTELLNRLPDGSVPACGIPLGTGAPDGFARDSLKSTATQNWVSDDGSVIFFQATPGVDCNGARQLYRRDLVTEATTLVSGPITGGTDTGLAVPGLIQAAGDGSWVIYKSRSQLDVADKNTSPDIYRWQAGTNTCLSCTFPGPAAAANVPNDVHSTAASIDGSHVYFKANNQLTPDAPASGQKLYVWSAPGGGAGKVRFVSPFAGGGGISPVVGSGGTMTPDGNVLVFAAGAGTTADSPSARQYYRYDDRNGSVVCISCPLNATTAVDTSLAPISSMHMVQQQPLSADGNTFVFSTNDSILAADANNEKDLYEWRNGRIGLLTDGRMAGQTVAVGAVSRDPASRGSALDGRDLMFTAPGYASYGAPDGSGQLYVARLGGGFPTPASGPTPCAGEDCQGDLAGAPQGHSPLSSRFIGPPNPTATRANKRCAKNQRRVRRNGKTRCAKKQRKQKQTDTNRRAGR